MASQAAYQSVLREIWFVNSEEEPGNRMRRVHFEINDNGFMSTAVTFVDIQPTNDPVLFNFVNKTVSYDESVRSPIAIFDSRDRISDSDGDLLESVTVVLVDGLDYPYDMLVADTGNSGLSINTQSTTENIMLTISGIGNLTLYQSVLETVMYINAFPGISLVPRILQVVTFDGMTESPPFMIEIEIIPFNDPPMCYFNGLLVSGDFHVSMKLCTTKYVCVNCQFRSI